MKIYIKFITLAIFVVLILGIWFPVIPFRTNRGWHGIGGEWCGVVWQPQCELHMFGFFTFKEIQVIIENHYYR